MADEFLFIETQVLPDPFCPETFQDEWDGFAAAARIPLPLNLGNLVISQTTPEVSDNAKIWAEVNADNEIIAFKSFSSLTGTWIEAEDFPYYFQDTGSVNAVEITTGEGIALNVDVVGRFFFVRIAQTNTSATVTFQIDTAPAVQLRKYGTTLIDIGDLQQGMIAILVYDGTNFQLLNPVPQYIGSVFATSAFTNITTVDIDLSFSLPTGKTVWQEVQLFATNYLDSQSGAAVTSTVTFKWNCGALLNTNVTQSATTGSGTSGQSFGVAADMQVWITTQFAGIVPAAIDTTNPLVVRASLAITGAHDPGNWMFNGKATAL